MNKYYIYFFVGCLIVIYMTYRFYRSDCKVSEWSEWTTCNTTCGGGTQQRYRTIIDYKNLDGKECPALMELRLCNTQNCPIDCQVSDWSEWSTCNATCGTGEMTRSRIINVSNMYGGKICPELIDTTNCKIKECPVDCIGEWLDVTGSTCNINATVASVKSQYYSIQREMKYGGVSCAYVNNFRRDVVCPINCSGEWKNVGECKVDDCKQSFDGLQTQNFKVLSTESLGGTCKDRDQTRRIPCKTYSCFESYFTNWKYSERGLYNQNNITGVTLTYRITEKGTLVTDNETTLIYNWKIQPLLDTSTPDYYSTLSLNYNKVNDTLSYTFNDRVYRKFYSGNLDKFSTSISFTRHIYGLEFPDTEFKIVYDPIHCKGHWENVTECNATCGNNLLAYSESVQKFIIDVNATYGGNPCEYQNNITMTRTCAKICLKSFDSDVYSIYYNGATGKYEEAKATLESTITSGNIIKKKYTNLKFNIFKTFTKILDTSTGIITYEYTGYGTFGRLYDNYIADLTKASSQGIVLATNIIYGMGIYNPILKWEV